MAAHQIGCCAVDLRGMGLSQGRRGHLNRWQQWVDDFTALYEAGAVACLSKDQELDEIVDAIRRAA